LYESSADAIAIHLGQRPKYLTFNGNGIETSAPRLIRLKTPILLDVLPMDGGDNLFDAMIEAVTDVGSRLTLRLEELDRYGSRVGSRMNSLIVRLRAEDIENLLRGKELPGH